MTISEDAPEFSEEEAARLHGIARLLLERMAETSEPDGACMCYFDDGTGLIAVDGTPTAYLDLARWALSQLSVERGSDS